jgi:hypothetical protein
LFGDDVSSIETRGNVLECKQITVNPIQEGIVADIDMSRVACGLASMSHQKGATVVLVKNSSMDLRNMELIKDGAEIQGKLPGITGSKEFGFSGAEGDSRLDATFPGNSSTSKLEDDARDRAAMASVSGPVRIYVAKNSKR